MSERIANRSKTHIFRYLTKSRMNGQKSPVSVNRPTNILTIVSGSSTMDMSYNLSNKLGSGQFSL